jgi:signal transduction protein with GAF and PtsI domain
MSRPEPTHPFVHALACRLAAGGAAVNLDAVLDEVLEHFDCQVGTIHGWDPEARRLHLRAQRGIPEHLLERIRVVPAGKGMAGIAAERCQPVQVCNLQSDTSGVARPAARETAMQGSIAVPMLVGADLRGTLGVGKAQAHEFSPAETDLLLAVGRTIGQFLPP